MTLFQPDELPFTLHDQIQCIRREIAMRERVYPRRIAEDRMRQYVADQELGCMRAVMKTLERLRTQQGHRELRGGRDER